MKHHFVHYTTITSNVNDGVKYHERRVDEETEAFLLHAKALHPEGTKSRERVCRENDQCGLGFAWPNNTVSERKRKDENGYFYNCFINREIETKWVPKLEEALKKRLTVK